MKSLSELRLVLGGLQDQVNECVNYLDEVATVMGWGGTGTKRKYIKVQRANGEAAPNLPANIREKVKAHYQRERGAIAARSSRYDTGDKVLSPASSPYITIEEASKILKMSDNGVRFRVAKGELPSTSEVRQTRTKGNGAKPHKVMVVSRAAVHALARGEVLPPARIVKTAPPRHPARRAEPKASKIEAQRQRTLDYLAKFDTDNPLKNPGTPRESRMLGPLVRRGYLKAKDDGYVRTPKEFSLKPTKKRG